MGINPTAAPIQAPLGDITNIVAQRIAELNAKATSSTNAAGDDKAAKPASESASLQATNDNTT